MASRVTGETLQCRCDGGNVIIEAPRPDSVTLCDCSICRRYMALWAYYLPDAVTVRIGEPGVERWQRNERVIEFVRCADCGGVTHYRTLSGDPDPLIAINCRLAEPECREIPVRYVANAGR
ncbi:GFA family protein [Salinicola aestuarinus]|uniref:GFA family protein n=1 Tax=Salinicola aestuarinus TaxID=1949082 RepID=UPI000DA2021E|nr:aldehyde-activating protein [Salinicola aestuarinus]